jgi:PIN domain nuclease of toxin-antitoxin system
LAEVYADSYAMVAMLEGNRRYAQIFGRREVVTSSINVLEVYATLLRRIEPSEARGIATSLLSLVVPLPSELALSAAEFRHSMRARKRDCSYVDAWGYAAALHLRVPFLTGDPAFRNVDNVDFIE